MSTMTDLRVGPIDQEPSRRLVVHQDEKVVCAREDPGEVEGLRVELHADERTELRFGPSQHAQLRPPEGLVDGKQELSIFWEAYRAGGHIAGHRSLERTGLSCRRCRTAHSRTFGRLSSTIRNSVAGSCPLLISRRSLMRSLPSPTSTGTNCRPTRSTRPSASPGVRASIDGCDDSVPPTGGLVSHSIGHRRSRTGGSMVLHRRDRLHRSDVRSDHRTVSAGSLPTPLLAADGHGCTGRICDGVARAGAVGLHLSPVAMRIHAGGPDVRSAE